LAHFSTVMQMPPSGVQRQLSAFACPSCGSELCDELRSQQTAVECDDCGFEFLVEPPPSARKVTDLLSSDDEEEEQPTPRSEAADPPSALPSAGPPAVPPAVQLHAASARTAAALGGSKQHVPVALW